MNFETDPQDPSSASDWTTPDLSGYERVLRSLAELLRTTDFTGFIGGMSFTIALTNETFDADSNIRSLDRSGDVVAALSYLFLTLLGHIEDPNEMAATLAEEVDSDATEMSHPLKRTVIPQEDLNELMATSPHYTMSLEEFFEISDLPSEEMFSLVHDMIKLDQVEDVEDLFNEE